ncbi:MAG: hypothetical protein GC166_07145 [Alphaproteobacteria bacterium]|nr:hypothetical protein [Alphaproteobacteria bacterium]
MAVFPAMKIRDGHSCGAGELVRLSWGDRPLAIIARSSLQAFEIVLEETEGGAAPRFYELPRGDNSVVSYGTNYVFEVDQRGLKASQSYDLYQINGAVVVGSDEILMRVYPGERNRAHSPIYVNLLTGMLANSPVSSECMAFPSWELLIARPHSQNLLSLIKFSAQP